MAHPPHVKAEALAMLITGESVTHVAKTMGIPKQTISRWQVEADQLLREVVRFSPKLRAIGAVIREVLPGLARTSDRNGTKKKQV